ncbi:MAG: PTS sugar transporter subunit IIA [Acidobacteria bacterium]|jgi:mannitol/fructose-specific phosphotransferase system IIA component (Ntr-type)|nr:PTS sugar transporter subunit IIA [Acidobacteriota bacterium]
MELSKYLKKEAIFITDYYENTDSFYSDYTSFLKQKGIIQDRESIKRLFIRRENVHSTGIKKGAAVPHIYSEEFPEFIFSLALIKKGMDFKAPDGKNVFLVFILMSSERDVGLHLKSLSLIARLAVGTDIVEAAMTAQTPDDIYNIFIEKEKMLDVTNNGSKN